MWSKCFATSWIIAAWNWTLTPCIVAGGELRDESKCRFVGLGVSHQRPWPVEHCFLRNLMASMFLYQTLIRVYSTNLPSFILFCWGGHSSKNSFCCVMTSLQVFQCQRCLRRAGRPQDQHKATDQYEMLQVSSLAQKDRKNRLLLHYIIWYDTTYWPVTFSHYVR